MGAFKTRKENVHTGFIVQSSEEVSNVTDSAKFVVVFTAAFNNAMTKGTRDDVSESYLRIQSGRPRQGKVGYGVRPPAVPVSKSSVPSFTVQCLGRRPLRGCDLDITSPFS